MSSVEVKPTYRDEINKLRGALEGVSGYFSLDEAWALYRAVRDFPLSTPLRVVEIGSYKGRSTIAICLALIRRSGGTCISIDPHAPTGKDSYVREHGVEDTFQDFLANVERAGASAYAKPVNAISARAFEQYDRVPIDVLFIDGSHDYDDVRLDIKLWTPLLRVSSVVAFNDPYAPGVNRAIREYLQSKPRGTLISDAYHVNNTLFLCLNQGENYVGNATLQLYLFVERQNFKLFKLLLKGLLEAARVIYRRPVLAD